MCISIRIFANIIIDTSTSTITSINTSPDSATNMNINNRTNIDIYINTNMWYSLVKVVFGSLSIWQ